MKAKRISLRSLLVISPRAAGRHYSHALRLPVSLFKPAAGSKRSESRRSAHSCSQPVLCPPNPPSVIRILPGETQARCPAILPLPHPPTPPPPRAERHKNRERERERDAAFNPKMRSVLKASSCQGSTLLEAGRSDVNCKYPSVMMMVMVFCFV